MLIVTKRGFYGTRCKSYVQLFKKRFFYHPAGITLIGGAVVALIGSGFQFSSDYLQNKRDHYKQIMDQKIIIATSFPSEFHKDLNLLETRVYLRSFNKFHSNLNDKDAHGRTLADDRQLNRKIEDEYIKNGEKTTTISAVTAWFCHSNIDKAAENLYNIMEGLEHTEPINNDALMIKTIYKFDADAEVQLRVLTQGMTDEIRSDEKFSSGGCT